MQKCLNKTQATEDYDTLFLHVFAPSAVEFTEWLLKQAIMDGVKRLYFLARDGWLFYHVAQQMVSRRNYDIEIRYLKISRYAIRSAGYHLSGEKCLDLICAGGIDTTFEKIMKRAGLEETEAFEIARLTGYEEKYRQVLKHGMIQELKEKLKNIPCFFEYVSEYAKKCYPPAMGYLTQMGLKDDISYAIVDSGWIGTMQQSIQLLLERPIMGYYFGLYEIPRGAEKDLYRAYYFTPEAAFKRKVYFSNCLFETVFSSPEGMTIGYEQCINKSYQALESKKRNPNAFRMYRNLDLLSAYTQAYLDEENTKEQQKDTLSLTEQLFSLLMGKPEEFEAEAFGMEKFCDDVLEFKLQPLARGFAKEELRKRGFFHRILIKANIKKEVIQEVAWPEAAIRLSDGKVRYHFWQEHLYKYFMYIRKAAGIK